MLHWTDSLQQIYVHAAIRECNRGQSAVVPCMLKLTRRSLYVGIHFLAIPKMSRHTAPAATDTQSLWDMQQRTHGNPD